MSQRELRKRRQWLIDRDQRKARRKARRKKIMDRLAVLGGLVLKGFLPFWVPWAIGIILVLALLSWAW